MDSIGVTIRRFRRWRGMSLEQLAGLSGLSKGYLSKIENERSAIDKRSTLVAIAGALRVSLYDITGDGLEIRDPQAGTAIPAIRDALLSTDLDGTEPPVGELAVLLAETQLLAALRQANQDAEVGARLPDLLVALHTHAEKPEALRSLVTATHTTALLTKGLGAFELAWIAAERGHEAAQRLGEPGWVGLAEFARTQALSGLGAHKRAAKLAERALDDIPADAYDVRGALTLTTGYTESVLGGDATAALDEAAGLAEHVAHGNRNFLLFSPANVVLWRISSALERGDHAEAARLAETLDPAELAIDSRRTTFLIEHARALYGIRRPDEEVVSLLIRAEKLGHIRTRSNPFVREIISTMLARTRREGVAREVRGMADRMGLLKPA
ncbi:transcriptional regulator with XRE-family HTH domain [Amycolatopsis lexingtonensis]|uniref:Transcriptional regulator with XRE-family HTH domain n=1 Tax=Amycolatopsis lexingtonensis TaxID=218822 RepID=A0ABR9HVW0_9PSEU|nr:helix-turn-helix transcriptional regulator [Amycolatopsis lexingtonensis]MBE1495042.1 transcriptional regulator with XRE-family HTH domain [Amycolatopsis lexingtonensis]